MGIREFSEEELTSRAFFSVVDGHKLAAAIAQRHGVQVSDMLGRRCFRELTSARTALILALHLAGWSTKRIARFMGRHHKTIQGVIASRNCK